MSAILTLLRLDDAKCPRPSPGRVTTVPGVVPRGSRGCPSTGPRQNCARGCPGSPSRSTCWQSLAEAEHEDEHDHEHNHQHEDTQKHEHDHVHERERTRTKGVWQETDAEDENVASEEVSLLCVLLQSVYKCVTITLA